MNPRDARTRTVTVFAPAKINLYLHVTGRRGDGYHLLDSLVAFADIGDRVSFAPANDFSFDIQGPYAAAFPAGERDASSRSSNLAVRAVWALSRALHLPPRTRMTLTKNLPLASGLGGGSADAAAALWGLMEWWGVDAAAVPGLDGLMRGLGADVPACLSCGPQWVAGAGEKLTPAALPEIPVVLVNPGRLCRTADVFAGFGGDFGAMAEKPGVMDDGGSVIAFLAAQDNMLTRAAVNLVPEISSARAALEKQPGCRLARMSGSGATCFGLFDAEEAAVVAAENILTKNPRWWVRAGTLNRPERY
jgi:4-diphosphocytidyl-2-C-methyl-D-erythritol kinase